MLWLLAASCQTTPEVPPACDQMCAAAAGLYGGCLSDWGVDWTAAGYRDEDDFLRSCETWGWEMNLLQADAIAQETWSDAGWLADTCATRRDALSAEDAACSAFTDIEWNNVPWSPDDGDTGR